MSRRPIFFFIIFILLFMTARHASAQDSIRLEHKYLPDQNLRYRVTALMAVGLIDDVANPESKHAMTVQISGGFTQQVRRAQPGGDAEIVYIFDGFKSDYIGGEQNLPAMNPIGALVGRGGEIKSLVGATGNPMEQLTFMNPTVFGMLSAAFVEKDLKARETWSKDSVFTLGDKNKGGLKGKFVLGGITSTPDGGSVAIFDGNEAGRAEYAVSGDQQSVMHAVNEWQAENRFRFSNSRGCIDAVSGVSTTRMTITIPASQGRKDQVVRLDVKMKYDVALIPDSKKE